MSNYYHSGYFSSSIFKYDYAAIADAIINQYHPETIIEFGCGTGDLAKALAVRGVKVEAIDGYSIPDFTGIQNIRFTKVDLNNVAATEDFLKLLGRKFDLAISIEVAEHLNPAVSESFIRWMTSMADVVVFSAAVPDQDGDGHINCRSRSEWYQLLKTEKFIIADTLRQNFTGNNQLGLWHQLNIVDYVHKDSVFAKQIDPVALIDRLIAAETFAASQCFSHVKKLQHRRWAMNLQPVKFAIQFRNVLTKALGKTSIEV